MPSSYSLATSLSDDRETVARLGEEYRGCSEQEQQKHRMDAMPNLGKYRAVWALVGGQVLFHDICLESQLFYSCMALVP
jgi:hypothetical protein